MYVALPSSRVNSSAPLVRRHDRVTREATGYERKPGFWFGSFLLGFSHLYYEVNAYGLWLQRWYAC